MKRRASLATFALLVFALLSTAASSAAVPPPFWTKCENGVVGEAAAGQCRVPRGIAVDPDNGHLYIGDQGNNRINEFTAWGVFVKAWGWGVADGAPELQTCGPGAAPPTATCLTGLEGSGAGQFANPMGVALDASGNVYVVDLSNHRVQKFNPAGEFLLMFGGGVDQGPNHAGNVCTAANIAEGETCGAGSVGAGDGQFGEWGGGNYIAVGPGETVYVGDQERIQEFEADGTYLKSLSLPGETVRSLAVDPGEDLYVSFVAEDDPTLSKPDVHKLSPTGAPVCTIEAENPNAIATDSAGNVYVVDGHVKSKFRPTEVRQFNSACADKQEPFGVGELGGESPTDFNGAVTGIATSSACNVKGTSVYVSNADFLDSFIRAYGNRPDPDVCPPPKVPPEISAQYAASVGASDAVLRAQINPHFWEDTTYYLQYGTEKCSEGGCSEQPPAPGSTLKGASTDEDVTTAGITLSGLSPATTYHYRFVSQSSGGGPVVGEGGKVGTDGEEGTFTTFPAPSAPDPSLCPANQAFRTGASAKLPDCRAYEMVSPVDKNNGDIAVLGRFVTPRYPTSLEQSSADGERLTYSSQTAFGDALSAPFTSQYLATRKAGEGWFTHAIVPPRESKNLTSVFPILFEDEFKAFSADLCNSWLLHTTDPILAPGAVPGYLNLYRRDNCGEDADGYEALSTVKPPKEGPDLYMTELQGFSADGTHAFFTARDKLTADAAEIFGVSTGQLYEFSSGDSVPRYVCVLPNGKPSGGSCSAGTVTAGGSVTGNRENNFAGAISADGSRVYWSANANAIGKLYLRQNPDREQSTIEGGECSEPEKACTFPVSTGPAQFWAGARDGSRALYSEAGKLFEFDLEAQSSTLIAEGVTGVAGAGEDASRVYFASTKVLSETANSEGDKAQVGKPNLYLYDAGEATTTFIATLSSEDVKPLSLLSPIDVKPIGRASRVSPDGRHFAFTSAAGATGYDNADAQSGEADTEVFFFSADTAELDCISCNPSGARPKGSKYKVNRIPEDTWAAAQVPPWESHFYAPRVLSEDGSRLFFESADALVLRDTNGVQDVYEWQRADTGKECDAAGAELFVPSAGGCLSLISSGESPTDSNFADASPDGRDVFFKTEAGLLPQDPGLIDIYDARQGGGLPPPPAIVPTCEGEACQGPLAAPNDPTPGSSSFEGAGNVAQVPKARCAKGKVRRKGRCAAKKNRKSTKRTTHSRRAPR